MSFDRGVRRTLNRLAADDELAVALATARDVQETIRHADVKATALIGVLFAVVTAGGPSIDSASGVLRNALAVVFAASMSIAGTHLALVLWPRIAGPPAPNSLALANLAAGGSPAAGLTAARARRQAWDFAAHLSAIALRKHRQVRRSLPWIGIATLIAVGCLMIPSAG